MDTMSAEEREYWGQTRSRGYHRYLGHSIRHSGGFFAGVMLIIELVSIWSGGESRYEIWQMFIVFPLMGVAFGGPLGAWQWSDMEKRFLAGEPDSGESSDE